MTLALRTETAKKIMTEIHGASSRHDPPFLMLFVDVCWLGHGAQGQGRSDWEVTWDRVVRLATTPLRVQLKDKVYVQRRLCIRMKCKALLRQQKAVKHSGDLRNI
jgi:hypothetical protein